MTFIYIIFVLVLLIQLEEMRLNYSERKRILKTHGTGEKAWLVIRLNRILRAAGISKYTKSGRTL